MGFLVWSYLNISVWICCAIWAVPLSLFFFGQLQVLGISSPSYGESSGRKCDQPLLFPPSSCLTSDSAFNGTTSVSLIEDNLNFPQSSSPVLLRWPSTTTIPNIYSDRPLQACWLRTYPPYFGLQDLSLDEVRDRRQFPTEKARLPTHGFSLSLRQQRLCARAG